MNGTTEDEETSPSSTPTLNSSTLQKHEYAEVPTIKVAMIIQTEGPLSPDAGANMDVTTQDGGPQSCGSVASIELAAQPGVTGIENTTGEEAVSDDCRDNGSLPSNTPLPANKMLKPQLKPIDLHAFSNVKVKQDYLREQGQEASRLSTKAYPFVLVFSLLLVSPLLIVAMAMGSHDDVVIILTSVAAAVNLVVWAVYSAACFEYSEAVLLKARGKNFVWTVLWSIFFMLTLSWLLTLLAWFEYRDASPTTNDEPQSFDDYPKADGSWMVLVLSLSRVAQTFFMAALSGRLNVVYQIFVRHPAKSLSQRQIKWIYWKPVIWLVSLQVLSTLPYLITVIISLCDATEVTLSSLTEILVIVGMWLMAIARAALFLWFGVKTRHVETLYSDFYQNLRAGLVEAFVMLTMCLLWSIFGVVTWVILLNQLASAFMGISYLLDGFTVPLIMGRRERRVMADAERVSELCTPGTSTTPDMPHPS